jgi:hypothetical protein
MARLMRLSRMRLLLSLILGGEASFLPAAVLWWFACGVGLFLLC